MSEDGNAKDGPRSGGARELARTTDATHAASDTTSSADATSSQDVVLLGPKTADGNGIHVLRARSERVEAGELRALREGQPISGEIVKLEPRKDMPLVCDVRESWTPPKTAAAAPVHKGPAQVATTAYRERWDEIFGARDATAKTARESN